MTKNEALFDLSKAFSTLHYTSSCTPQNEPYRVWYMLTHENGTCVIEQSCAALNLRVNRIGFWVVWTGALTSPEYFSCLYNKLSGILQT